MATSFSLVGAASELATRARAWLDQTSPDASPESYQIESPAASSEGFSVVVAAVYTLGPRTIYAGGEPADKNPGEEPLLLRAKLVAAPDPDRINLGSSCQRRVRKLIDGHVRALASGMTAEQLADKGAVDFIAKEVLGRVSGDLAKSGDALLVYGIRIDRISVQTPPIDRIVVDIVAEAGAAPTPGFAVQIGAKNVGVEINTFVNGGEVSVAVAVVDPATNKGDWSKQIMAAGVEAELRTEFQGKTMFRVKLKADSRPSPS